MATKTIRPQDPTKAKAEPVRKAETTDSKAPVERKAGRKTSAFKVRF